MELALIEVALAVIPFAVELHSLADYFLPLPHRSLGIIALELPPMKALAAPAR